jgi:hypothetical protein
MFNRLSRRWDLVKASASVLQQDIGLLLFPLMSIGAPFLVLASFALPVLGLGMLNGVGRRAQGFDPNALKLAFAPK